MSNDYAQSIGIVQGAEKALRKLGSAKPETREELKSIESALYRARDNSLRRIQEILMKEYRTGKSQ